MLSQVTRTRYRIVGSLGEGGMARVFRAEDTLLGRTVAMKVLREQFAGDTPFLDGFRQEAQAAAQLSHPNIVAVYDVSEVDGRPCLIMECVDGGNLKELLQDGPLPIARAVDVGIQIGEAVAAAHAKGIIHRDIKPQNVLVQAVGDDTARLLPSPEAIRVKITDFGIARALGASVRSAGTGEIIGTIHYLSPEQIQGKPAGPASDVYAIGVVTYEMLTGRLPFVGESAIAVALKHIQEPPEPLTTLSPGIPPALEAIVLRAMAKSPDERFESAAAFVRALREYRDFGQQATAAFRAIKPAEARPPAGAGGRGPGA
ncbi:MAG: serine/threonine protein kinase, partial [Chloroflexi bacterium]|nr:serine/threonine protein kinase [Chloroflexota bacterium]